MNKNSKEFLFGILTLFCILEYVDLKKENKTIGLDSLDIEEVYSSPLYLRIEQNKEKQRPNYIKIQVKRNNKEDNNDCIISYYQMDSNFEKRNQLSQSISNITTMWLTSGQIRKDFYLSVECTTYQEYNFSIISSESIKLDLGEQYNYYVTEENKNIDFEIINSLNNNGTPFFWISSKDKLDPKSKLEKFTFNGNINDSISIGSLILNGTKVTVPENLDGLQIVGYLDENSLENSFSNIDKEENIDMIMNIDSRIYQHLIELKDRQYTIKRNNNTQGYSYYSFLYHNKEIFKNGELYLYPPLNPGTFYNITIKKGQMIGLIPMKFDNFNYLTYQTSEIIGRHNASIFDCDEYPFCTKNIDLSKLKKLLYYKGTTFTFTKDEYDSEISPVSKKQKILVIMCEDDYYCKVGASIFTEKDDININPKIIYNKFIRKGNTDNLLLNLIPIITEQKNNINWFLNIEYFSGNLSIVGDQYLDANPLHKYKNIYSYEIEDNNVYDKYSLSILSESNSFYSVSVNYLEEKNEEKEKKDNNLSVLPNKHYLFPLYNDILDMKINLNVKEYHSYYSQFFLVEKEFKVINKIVDDKENMIQYIFNKQYNISNFNVSKNENLNTSIGFSFFEYSTEKSTNDKGFILAKDVPYKFGFSNKEPDNSIKDMTFMVFLTEVESDLNIKVQLLDDDTTKYNLTILNIELNKAYTIEKNHNTIRIEEQKLKNFCQENQLCIISFKLEPIGTMSDSLSYIEINAYNGYDESSIDKSKYRFAGYILTTVFVIFDIIIFICIVRMILVKNKKTLKEEVNEISFKADEDRDKHENVLY